MSCHRMKGALLAAGTLLALGAMPIDAQSVEAIMRAGERLDLSEQQVQQLDVIRREAVAQRTGDMAEIAELRSRRQAGQIRPSELMAAQEDQQEAREARAEERRASIEAILTAEQLESVLELRRRADRGRPGIGRPGVGRSGPGFRPGSRPRARAGFAPRARRGFRPADGW